MRIIDKNTDFYDFYQNLYPDQTFTFDRRDSYLLTKDIMCDNLYYDRYWSWKEQKYKNYQKYNYLLLQICNSFWLFSIEPTKITDYDRIKDYKVELMANWKNFDKPRKLISLDNIEFRHYYGWGKEPTVEDRVNEINRNDYKIRRNLNDYTYYVGDFNKRDKKEKHIPLLKASGLAPLMDAHEVFLTFEQYFALEKSDSERREPIGTTDIDKVESHGFDKKTSFRGKL